MAKSKPKVDLSEYLGRGGGSTNALPEALAGRRRIKDSPAVSPKMIALVAMLLIAVLAFRVTAHWGNPYAASYRGLEDAKAIAGYEAVDSGLKVYSSDDLNHDLKVLMAEGYLAYGELSFGAWTHAAPETQVLQTATRTGAEVILLPAKSARRFAGALPPSELSEIAVPGDAGAGKRSIASKIGFASDASAVRFYMDPRQFGAIFLAKFSPGWGFDVDAVDSGIVRRDASSVGLTVRAVVKDSPAEAAGFLPGDVLTAIDSVPIQSLRDFQGCFARYRGKTVRIQFLRGGALDEKEVSP